MRRLRRSTAGAALERCWSFDTFIGPEGNSLDPTTLDPREDAPISGGKLSHGGATGDGAS
jgi:hypothetical protein